MDPGRDTMSISDADRLAYDTAPRLRLKDGTSLPLHYGYGGLRRIEKRFGSVQKLFDGLASGIEGELYEAVFGGLMCALWQTGITEEELEARLDETEIEHHATVLGEALQLAFPKQAQASLADAPASASQNGSTGPSPTTSPESSAALVTTSSGE